MPAKKKYATELPIAKSMRQDCKLAKKSQLLIERAYYGQWQAQPLCLSQPFNVHFRKSDIHVIKIIAHVCESFQKKLQRFPIFS